MTDSTRSEPPAGDTADLHPGDALPSQLSAFVDDQLPSPEADLFVRRLLRDGDLKQTMSRYLLIGEALRQPSRRIVPGVSRDFSARVATALENDLTPAKSTASARTLKSSSLWKNVAGLALAASVAIAAVVLVRQPDGTPVSSNLASTASSTSSASDSYIVPVSATGPAAPIPAARLTNYVVAHSEFSSPLGRQNLMTGLLSQDHQLADTQVVQTESEVGSASPAVTADQ